MQSYKIKIRLQECLTDKKSPVKGFFIFKCYGGNYPRTLFLVDFSPNLDTTHLNPISLVDIYSG